MGSAVRRILCLVLGFACLTLLPELRLHAAEPEAAPAGAPAVDPDWAARKAELEAFPPEPEKQITVEFWDEDFLDAVQEVAELAQLNLVVTVATGELGGAVTGRFVRTPAIEVLRSVVDAAGLSLEIRAPDPKAAGRTTIYLIRVPEGAKELPSERAARLALLWLEREKFEAEQMERDRRLARMRELQERRDPRPDGGGEEGKRPGPPPRGEGAERGGERREVF